MTGDLTENSLKTMIPRERRLVLSWQYYSGFPEGSDMTMGASAEEGESKDLTTTTEVLAAQVEGTMRPRIQV